jgi:hypothetical protein
MTLAHDRRHAFRGHDAPTVTGGKRLVASYLKNEVYEALRGLAVEQDRSMSATVARALEQFVGKGRHVAGP